MCHTSYTDVLDLAFIDRLYLIEHINTKQKENNERMEAIFKDQNKK